MTNAEQDHVTWRTEQQRRAQANAFTWAERATVEYREAIRNEDDARAHRSADGPWYRDRMAESRSRAQVHGVRSIEALKLAEMWARVAHAHGDGDPPHAYALAEHSTP